MSIWPGLGGILIFDEDMEEEINDQMNDLIQEMVKDGKLKVKLNGKDIQDIKFAFDGDEAAITAEDGNEKLSITVG